MLTDGMIADLQGTRIHGRNRIHYQLVYFADQCLHILQSRFPILDLNSKIKIPKKLINKLLRLLTEALNGGL